MFTMLTSCLDTACLQHSPHSEPAQEGFIQPSVPIPLRTSVSTSIRSSATSLGLDVAKLYEGGTERMRKIDGKRLIRSRIDVAIGCAGWG